MSFVKIDIISRVNMFERECEAGVYNPSSLKNDLVKYTQGMVNRYFGDRKVRYCFLDLVEKFENGETVFSLLRSPNVCRKVSEALDSEMRRIKSVGYYELANPDEIAKILFELRESFQKVALIMPVNKSIVIKRKRGLYNNYELL